MDMDRTVQVLAMLVIALIPLGYLCWIIVALQRSPYTVSQSLVFFGNLLLARVLWRASVPSGTPIPSGRGAIIVANHRSSIDPLFIQLVARRRVHWMVAAEFASNPLIAWIYRFTQVIPTSRSGRDTAATRKAIELAAGGGWVGMFPEGTINEGSEPLLPCRTGAIAIAAKARVPIVPCYIVGSPYGGTALSPLFRSARVRLIVGEPIDPNAEGDASEDRDLQREVTLKVMRSVAALGGFPEFEPRLAGRQGRVLSNSSSLDRCS